MAMSFVLNRLWCGHVGTVVIINMLETLIKVNLLSELSLVHVGC